MAIRQRKHRLAPITDDMVAGNNTQQPVATEEYNEIPEGMISVDSSQESYISSQKSDGNQTAIEAELKALTEYADELNTTVEKLRLENSNLLLKIAELSEKEIVKTDSVTTRTIEELKSEISKLSEMNNTFLLKNSELELEVTRLNEALKNAHSEISNKLHVYTKPGYTARGGYSPSQNGYQTWN